MNCFSAYPTRRLARMLGVLVALTLVAAACGGSDSGEVTSEAELDGQTSESPVAQEPDPTEPPVVVPTSTPPPTPTPLPTSTPEPLEAPTPSSVLLTTAFTNSSKVTTVGIDEVFFGMTPEQAAEAASTQWVELPSTSGTCYRVTPANGPDRVTLWVVDGFVERLDVEHPDIRTPSRLGVGNTVAELRSQLGDRLTVTESGDGSQVATFTPTDPGDREFRIIFELKDDQVVHYRTGRIGIIQRAAASC